MHLFKEPRVRQMPIAHEAFGILVVPVFVFCIVHIFYPNLIIESILGIAIGFVLYFFRNPNRACLSSNAMKTILAPADGKVIAITDIADPIVAVNGHKSAKQISIFLSVFNVHINRFPLTGEIVSITHFPGKFFGAWRDKASTDNEQTHFVIDVNGRLILLKVIAGFIARRIVWWVKAKDILTQGTRFSLIKFGSRVDLVIPADSKITVKVGDIVTGGISVLGELS